jgi:HD-GYP domain-containing protein (c-di-GMP phosphodiesterase class II)
MSTAAPPSGGNLAPLRAVWPVAFLASPLALLFVLLREPRFDPVVPAPEAHFAIVTFTAIAGEVLAGVLLVIAERLREPRGFYVGLAFAAMASFYFVHGLLTPGVIFNQASSGIHWAPLVGLSIAAGCLALSTIRPGRHWVLSRRRPIGVGLLVVWGLFLALSVWVPDFLSGHTPSVGSVLRGRSAPAPVASTDEYATSVVARWQDARHDYTSAAHHKASAYAQVEGRPWLGLGLCLAAAGLMALTALRYARQYRLSRLPSHATVVWGMLLLLESLLAFVFASVWRISWWEYHVLALLGIGVVVYGLSLDYQRGPGVSQAFASLLAGTSVDTLQTSYTEALTALTAAVEARDPYTRGHSEKVARLALSIGERLRLPPESLRTLYYGGLLHDIGKIAIPDSILHKQGPLNAEEFAAIKEHPGRAEDIVARIPSLRSLRGAIRWHHERLDGSGYPDGLRGDAIPLDARILAVADVYDAMTSGRVYRSAFPIAEVLDWLRAHAGTQLDERSVSALMRAMADEQTPATPSTMFAPSAEGSVRT